MIEVVLKPGRKLVEEIVDWLCTNGEVREENGAKSLSHLLVIVPTAQSGRRLRLRLARRFPSGIIPPSIRLPAQLLQPEKVAIATRTDELAAFWEARGGKDTTLDIAAQLSDIRRILGANAMTFADVAGRIERVLENDEVVDLEIARWRRLAELEKKYFAALEKRGKTDRIIAAKQAIEAPQLPEGVETVVVAGVLDPLPAMWKALERVKQVVKLEVGETTLGLRRSQIIPASTMTSECTKVAEIFAAVQPMEELPALCLADAELSTGIEGALSTKGLKMHNPSEMRVMTSSLGHLVSQISALRRSESYSVFSAFIRGGDVRRWIKDELGYGEEQITAALTALDGIQAELLPEKLESIRTKAHGELRNIIERVMVQLRKRDLRGMLQAIFKSLTLDEREASAREFAAVAEVVNGLIDEIEGLPTVIAEEIFARRLEEATYSLESDGGEVITTDGWLELPYLDSDEVVIAGFCEGKVPESQVGHAFLPDRLRRGLGLPDNESRYERDRKILGMTLECRAEGAVKVLFHTITDSGDVVKPSRLLFTGTTDAELICRTQEFYATKVGTEEIHSADLPPTWKLALPIPPTRDVIENSSPSNINSYVRCPFNYYLEKLFGERTDDRTEELDASEFGTLVHSALEAWGMGALKDSEDAEAIALELEEKVDAVLGERFGTSVPAIVALQGESAKRRLRNFAEVQVAWHRLGWRIEAMERKLNVKIGHTRFHGRCDRVDYNPQTGQWCVIDYKTFDLVERAVSKKKGKWVSFQLPLYCAMLVLDEEFMARGVTRENVTAAYCVLGKTKENVAFSELITGETLPEAEQEIKVTIDRMERGIFWPPSKDNEWQWNFKNWIFRTPAESVSEEWLNDQIKRLDKLSSEAGDE